MTLEARTARTQQLELRSSGSAVSIEEVEVAEDSGVTPFRPDTLGCAFTSAICGDWNISPWLGALEQRVPPCRGRNA